MHTYAYTCIIQDAARVKKFGQFSNYYYYYYYYCYLTIIQTSTTVDFQNVMFVFAA